MRRMGWTDIGPKRGGGGDRCGQGQSRRNPDRPQRKGANHEPALFAMPLVSSLFSACARAAAAGRRLCRGRVRAAGADRGRRGRDRVGAPRRPRRGRRGDRHAGKRRRHDRGRAGRSRASPRPEAQLANLRIGKRPEEIAVLEATLKSAEAQKRGGQARADAARRPAEARHLDTGRLRPGPRPRSDVAMRDGRPGQGQSRRRAAAGARRDDQGGGEPGQAGRRRSSRPGEMAARRKRTISAPSAGRVDDIIRNPGDVAGPSAPVISMLPDGAVKLKALRARGSFFVGDGRLASRVRCDGCRPGLTARVSYVSPDPEFTPPVIYSLETRQKLVYLVEARPEGAARTAAAGADRRCRIGEVGNSE